MCPPTTLPGLTAAEGECWQRFIDSSTRVVDILNRNLMDNHSLSLFDVMLLGLLAKADGGSMRMGDLAESMSVIPSRVTQQTHRLETQGLLRRSTYEVDRRGVIAGITNEGRLRLESALKTYARSVRMYYLDPLSRQQMSALGDGCRRISAGLKKSDRRPPFG